MEELQYKAVFSFELLLSSCKIGKEGIDDSFYIRRKDESASDATQYFQLCVYATHGYKGGRESEWWP